MSNISKLIEKVATQRNGVFLHVLLFIFLPYRFLIAQSGNCGHTVPFHLVNLTGNPAASYISPSGSRNGNCCSSSFPDRCVEFEIYLHPSAIGILFDIYSGAVPPGSMYYQINCGTPIPVGQMVCLSGAGPHHLTFCKPGNNPNSYIIRSIQGGYHATGGAVRMGCSITLRGDGLNPATVRWRDITGGGVFDSLLSCITGCSATIFTPSPGIPSLIEYEICGSVLDTICNNYYYVCDTVQVTVFPELRGTDPDTVFYCSADGGITLNPSVSGGNGIYSYRWLDRNGNLLATTPTFFADTGFYTVEVRDGFTNCPPFVSSYVVKRDEQAVVDPGAYPPVCADFPAIQLNGIVTGSSGGYWSGGNGIFSPHHNVLNAIYTPDIGEIINKSFTLTLTSFPDTVCPVTSQTVTIAITDSILPLVTRIKHVSCFGGNDAEFSVTATGGVAPLMYSIDGLGYQTDGLFTSLNAGNYTVYVRDALGCMAAQPVAVFQPDPITVQAITRPVNCHGGNDGAIELNVSGGTAPYQISWSNGVNQWAINHLASGNYAYTVTDHHGCLFSGNYFIYEPDSIEIQYQSHHPSCNGFSDGSIDLSVSGGTMPYAYSWSNGLTTQDISGLPAGMFQIVVTDAHQCTDSLAIVLTEPDFLVLDETVKHVSCYNSNDGAVHLHVGGGTAPYSYIWHDGYNGISRDSMATGIYSVTVYDSRGCGITGSFEIMQPDSLAIDATLSHVSCFGGNNGKIDITVSGGAAPYRFLWSVSSTTRDIDSLNAGIYQVTVTDNNNCMAHADYSITQPDDIVVVLTASDVSCHGGNNGKLSADVSGGMMPYAYLWSNGDNDSVASSLTAGAYQLTITDANGCVRSVAAQINQPYPLQSLVTLRHVSCFQGNDGFIDINTFGGAMPYAYLWSDGATGKNRTQLTSGSYTVTITDARNCTDIQELFINQNTPLQVYLQGTEMICQDALSGSVRAVVSGGMPPYRYSWSTGTSGNEIINSLPAGNYQVTVIDHMNCTASSSYNITTYAYEADFAMSDHDICLGESVTLNDFSVTSQPVINYFWDFGDGTTKYGYYQTHQYADTGAYTIKLVIALQNGCYDTIQKQVVVRSLPNANAGPDVAVCPSQSVMLTGSGGDFYEWLSQGDTAAASSAIHYVLPADTSDYILRVTNIYGCEDSDTVRVMVHKAASIRVTDDTIVCPGAEVVLQASGAVTYQWEPAFDLSCTVCDAPTVTATSARQYIVLARDQNGCVISDTVRIELAPLPGGIISFPDTVCAGTAVQLQAEANHQYKWSPAASLSSDDIYNPIATPDENTTYRVTVTNQYGCSVTDSVTIIVNAYPNVNFPDTLEICRGESTVITADTQYSYQWLPTSGLSCTDCPHPVANPMQSTLYIAAISSVTGCTILDSLYLKVNPLPFVHAGNDQRICRNDSIILQAAALDKMEVVWHPPAGLSNRYVLNPKASPTSSTVYRIAVTDSNGCTNADEVFVEVIDKVSFYLDDTIIVCKGTTVTLKPDSLLTGNMNIRYIWHPHMLFEDIHAPEQTFLPRQDEIITLIVESGKCVPHMQHVFVDVLPTPSVTIRAPEYVIAGERFQITASAFRADMYEWQPDSNLSCASCAEVWASIQKPTTLHVKVTADNGCIAEDTAYVKVVAHCGTSVFIPNAFSPNGDEINDRLCIRSLEWYGLRVFRIFNRWGQLIFETDNVNECWDGYFNGKPVNPDVYVYYVEGICLNGQHRLLKGNITVIR
jgi:gliding motility-associated-like protein